MGRKKKNNKKKYFGQEQEDAVIEYLKSKDLNIRNEIYEDKLKYAFYKLSENIINTYKYYHPDMSFEEQVQDSISYLHTKIERFNPVRSTNNKLIKIIVEEFGEKCPLHFIDYMPEGEIKCTIEDLQTYINLISDKLSPKCLEAINLITPVKAFSYFGTIVRNRNLGIKQKADKQKPNKVSYEDTYKVIHDSEEYSYRIKMDDDGSFMNEFF